MLDTRLLRSQMTLKGISTKDLADAQGWSMSTAYRKINGEVAWLIPELQIVKNLLGLDLATRDAIFLRPICPKRQICAEKSTTPLLQENKLCLTYFALRLSDFMKTH